MEGMDSSRGQERADLHLHTTYSDGALTPYELIKKAKEANLRIISITDHDNVSAIDDAIDIGRDLGVEVIPGVELSATVAEKEIHILGYFVDCKQLEFLEHLSMFRRERMRRAERIVEKLNSLNVPLKLEDVLERAGTGSIGRPHIASALVEEGHADSYREAFSKYIGYGCPAYEKKYQLSPTEALQLVATAKGLSFLAHPGKYLADGVLLQLIKAGIDGVEVVHPSHGPDNTAHYRGIVNEYFLLESGGSDFHGGKKNDGNFFGSFTIPVDWVENMRRRLF
ncbi:MAG TPA: PHP domain-containing protein [Bacteroidota bacterium]